MHESLSRELIRVHEPIVQALRDRDPAAAQEALRVHLENSYAEFTDSARPYLLAVG
jgi:DNA-binding GntR family transcriptional regulator